MPVSPRINLPNENDSKTSSSKQTKVKNAGFLLVHELRKNKVKDERSSEALNRFNNNRKKNKWAASRFIINPYEHITKKLSDEVPGEFIVEKHVFDLNFIQKLFVTLEIPSSCPIAYIISGFTFLVISAGVILFILSTNESMTYQPSHCDYPVCDHDATLCPGKIICEPRPYQFFDSLDMAFIIYFNIDYMLRFLSLWSAPSMLAGIDKNQYPNIDRFDFRNICTKYIVYFTKFTNIIDLASILPYYISLGASNHSSSSFVRVLRLSRLLRVLKLGKNSATLELLAKTFIQSGPSLSVAGFVIFLVLMVFASCVYILESGDFMVTSDYPDGQYFRPTLLGTANEATPFNSIGTAIYYTIVTMTTVGYGDIYPTSVGGRALADIGCISGILVLCLPLAVIASNFTINYQQFLDSQNAKFKEVLKESLASARAEALVAASRLESTVMKDDQKMKSPDFWDAHAGLHQRIDAVFADEKASVTLLTQKCSKLDSMMDEIENIRRISLAQRENLKRVMRFCKHIVLKMKNVSGHSSKEALAQFEKDDILPEPRLLWIPPSTFLLHTQYFYTKRIYDLSAVARFFVCLEDSMSCKLAYVIFFANICMILLGLVTFILATDKRYQYTPDTCDYPSCDNDATLCPGKVICEPRALQVFNEIDKACVIFFTIEYLLRMLTVWSAPCRLAGLVGHYWDEEELALAKTECREPMRDPRELSVPLKYVMYFFSLSNIIDFVAIVPFYISLGSSQSSSSSFVRILRLTRCLRLLKLMKNNESMHVLHLTMKESVPVLTILAFFIMLIAICFGSIIYIFEGGDFRVNNDVPDGAFMRIDVAGTGSEVSPVKSISIGLYWALVCCTTLGYGEVVPTTILGRVIACVCAFFGILVLALPISVVGSTFITQSEISAIKRLEDKKLMAEDSRSALAIHQEVQSNKGEEGELDGDTGSEEKQSKEDDFINQSVEKFHNSEVLIENRITAILVSDASPATLMEEAVELLKDINSYQNDLKSHLQDLLKGNADILDTCINLKDAQVSRIQLLRHTISNPNQIKVGTKSDETSIEALKKFINKTGFEVE